MAILNPYLNFNGNTEEAFKFYKSIFGGEFTSLVRFSDMPDQASNLKANERAKIMHVGLPIGKGNVLMGTDAIESMGNKLNTGNNMQLSITAESEEEANRIFKGLAAGGKIIVPQAIASWGDYFGMLNDKFGIQWMVNYPIKTAQANQVKQKEGEMAHH